MHIILFFVVFIFGLLHEGGLHIFGGVIVIFEMIIRGILVIVNRDITKKVTIKNVCKDIVEISFEKKNF